VRVEAGRSRRELVDHLIAVADEAPGLVVGLDFAFSFPAWFLEERDLGSARELWELVREEGEGWLEAREAPFWGWEGSRKPEVPEHFRRTEAAVREETGASPRSVLQLLGAGAVGTGSVRGMPFLLDLADAGFSVWPFDAPELPLVVEIYPRLLTGDVVKSDAGARARYLEREHPGLPGELRRKTASSGDAFDAAVSALAMARHAADFRRLPPARDRASRLEGAIWRPGVTGAVDAAPGGGAPAGEASAAGAPTVAAPGTRAGGRTLLEEALLYACAVHAGQRRKGPCGAPYISHLLGVCSLVLEAGGDEEQAAAALLHDAAEDQGGRERLEEIRARFGSRVAGIVEACSDTLEQPKPPWRPRKEAYVEHLRRGGSDALLVACADKLHNARATLRDVRRQGDEAFERFNASREETLWYHRAVANALVESELESWLVDQLARVVFQLEAAAEGIG